MTYFTDVSDVLEVLLGEGDGRHDPQPQQPLPQLLEAQQPVAVPVQDLPRRSMAIQKLAKRYKIWLRISMFACSR